VLRDAVSKHLEWNISPEPEALRLVTVEENAWEIAKARGIFISLILGGKAAEYATGAIIFFMPTVSRARRCL